MARTATGKATRVQSGHVIQAAAQVVPGLAGGSADLAPSNETEIRDAAHVIPAAGPARFAGRNLHFGIREHAMAAVTNGLALSGGFRPYAGTFLVFADYMKPALRLAAMMEAPSIFVFTHDSIGVGEDGPTHQPIEQLWMLRSIPGMTVWRPSSPLEVAVAWEDAIRRRTGPTAIVLSRQDVPEVPSRDGVGADDVRRGGYRVFEPSGSPQFVIAATGSEVPVAVGAALVLQAEGLRARVVSLPCLERFESQAPEYREQILPRRLPVVTVEAGSTVGWHRYTGRDGLAIGMDRFGASAPAKDLVREFGFTEDAIATRIRTWWQRR